jgi:hypothetical protein
MITLPAHALDGTVVVIPHQYPDMLVTRTYKWFCGEWVITDIKTNLGVFDQDKKP